MFLDDAPTPAQAVLAHARRHPFLVLSLALHAVPLAALYWMGSVRSQHIELDRQRQAIESGARLTEQARLEKRVHDMERIKSLLEQSTGARNTRKADDVQFSAQPRAPGDLLKEARELSRTIDKIERDTKAEQLAKLLDIPKEKALEQLAKAPKPAPAPEPRNAAEAAAKIEQLEAQARAALERRRQQLEQQRSGTQVAASAARGDGTAGQRQGGGRRGTGQGGGLDGNAGPGGRNGQGGQGGAGNGVTGGLPGPSVLDQMGTFANPDMPDRVTQEYRSGDLHDFFDGGTGHIPSADPGTMVKGAGTMIGPGGAYANRVYVNRWYLIGPFEGRHGEGLFANYRHPPEQGVVLDAVYRGKGGRLVQWDYVDMARYPLIPPVAAEDAVYYGYTEMMLDEEQDLTIWVGADDDAQLWLNDALVWRGGNVDKRSFFTQFYETMNTYVADYNLSEGKRVVHFRKGRNKLFFKLSNGPTRLFFSLVLTR